MATGLHVWSQVAANNATADTSIGWAEGQAPSSINDSARALMARVADFYKDLGGLTTAGSSTAFTVTSNRAFASAAVMAGSIIVIIPHATSGATPTLAVDGLTARQIRSATGTNIATGALIAGTPYAVLYVHASTEFILLGYTETFQNAAVKGTLTVTGATTHTGAVTLAAAIDGANGTVNLPQYTFTNDLDCGMYRIGANNIGLAVNGAKVLDVATTGLGVTGTIIGSSSMTISGAINGVTAPTVQTLLSGTAATFTPTAGAVRWRIRQMGAGAGGGAQITNAGATGGTTSFQVNSTGTAWTCIGGTGGAVGSGSGGLGGAGGTGGTDGSTGTKIARFAGSKGGTGPGGTSSGNITGGPGGNGPFGGAGQSAANNAGSPTAAIANTGSGGAGIGANSGVASGGGGTGEYVEYWVVGMTTATYTVGAAGAGGAAGTLAGGAGAAGIIIIEEFYS